MLEVLEMLAAYELLLIASIAVTAPCAQLAPVV